MAARGPQNGRRGLKSALTLDYRVLRTTLQNRFFDPSTPSMRKGCDGEWWNNGMVENNDENSGPLTSLPVNLLKATDCIADRLCQQMNECPMG